MAHLTVLLSDWRIFSILWVLWLGYSAWLGALIRANANAVKKHGGRRYYLWIHVAVGVAFAYVETRVSHDTTAFQATLSALVLIAMLRTAYQIGYWSGKRDRS